ncbi:tetratricopeptide repeat protein [Flavobacterium sp.]|uniref:tetratricopeptide repeat protein n=1 Tax=Flavobacterium sp. TaxID=239 RepID=UPI0038FC0284
MMKKILIVLLFPLLIFSQTNFEKGELLLGEAKFKQAQLCFENFLVSNPSHLKTIEYLGDIAGHTKSWDNALLYYKKLKQLKPNEANYYYKYGGALGMKATQVNKFKALGMIGEIRSSFEKAIVLNPKHIEARWALIELNLQLPGIVGGSETKAIQYSNELKELSPVDGYLARGHIEEYFKRFSLAEQQYKKAIMIGKSNVCSQKLADLYKNKMNQPQKAQKVLEEYNSNKKYY